MPGSAGRPGPCAVDIALAAVRGPSPSAAPLVSAAPRLPELAEANIARKHERSSAGSR